MKYCLSSNIAILNYFTLKVLVRFQDLRCEYQPVRIPTGANTNRTLKLDFLFFKKQLLCKVKEMDLDNIQIYKRLILLKFDIICSYSLSFPQYTNVFFLDKPRPNTVSQYTVR